MLLFIAKKAFLCTLFKTTRLCIDLVAQPVEQLTLNQWVESSILSQVTVFQKPLLMQLEAVFVFSLFSDIVFLHKRATF
jgi:hypothetical protein